MHFRKPFALWMSALIFCTALSGATMRHITIQSQTRPTALVSWGMSGETVRIVQNRLKELGFYSGPSDGVFGTQTYEAILAYQQANNLTADGIAGQETLDSLGLGAVINNTQFLKDLQILASAIHGEGRGEPYEGQVAIGSVILNRVQSDQFPNTVAEVVYQPGAFDAVSDKQIYLEPNRSAYQAAVDALKGWDPSEGSLYYWNPATATSRWIWSVPINKQIGRHVFGTK